MRIRYWRAGALLLTATVGLPTSADAQAAGQAAAERGWTVRSSAAVDLWFHGLAVVGYDVPGVFPAYSSEYVDLVRGAKQETGTYPTPLDSLAEELRADFEEDRVFQALHFLPLYFTSASREQMLNALMAVAKRRTRDPEVMGPDTRFGVRQAIAAFRAGRHRDVLARFVEVLGQEWDLFYGDYWARTVAADSGRYSEIQRLWNDQLAPALGDFLGQRRLDAGTIIVSPALGPEGRLYEGSPYRRLDNVLAVWAPPQSDEPEVSVFSVVRELCYPLVGEAVTARGDEKTSGRAAVRCGSMVLESYAPALTARYQQVFLRAAGAETPEEPLADPFEEAFPLDDDLLEALEERIRPASQVAEAPGAPTSGETRWVVRMAPQTDLWFHALAVIAADQPGPLGLYSADYERRIRQVKQQLGVYPTMLDSLAVSLRQAIAEESGFDVIHFVPLYFPRAKPERMLQALKAVAERRTDDTALGGRDTRLGILVMGQVMERRSARRLLKDLVEAVEHEWEVFYRDYWEGFRGEQESRIEAIQTMWDSVFVPQLDRYLERRRLAAGVVMPSPALGPEGRIVELDSFDPRDQVVAVQLPLSGDAVEASVFAFLKELCFVLVDERVPGEMEDAAALEDLRRRLAVRCGALILEFYAPTLVADYRRVFLDAVGAEESSSVEAFERVYAVDPEVFERLREQIRRR